MRKNFFLVTITIFYFIVICTTTSHAALVYSDELIQAIRDGKIAGSELINDKIVLRTQKSKLDGSILDWNIYINSIDKSAMITIVKDTAIITLDNDKIERATSELRKYVKFEYMLDDSKMLKDSVAVKDSTIFFIKQINGKGVDYAQKFISSLTGKKRLAIRITIDTEIIEEIFDIEGLEKAINRAANPD